MKTAITILFVLLAVIVAVGTFGYFHFEKRVEEIKARKAETMRADSIQSARERKIIDSLTTALSLQNTKINSTLRDLKMIRRQNEALEKRFDSIVIDMPDF